MSEELQTSAPRIAIPVPHSGEGEEDREYVARALPQYEEAVRAAGGQPVRIELGQAPAQVITQMRECDAVLLPGSHADVDPRKYHAARHEKTAASDPKRDAVDELLLGDAFDNHKPVLGICYGLQSLNVFRAGSLIQHIESPVDHTAGRKVAKAHTVRIEPESKLARIIGGSQAGGNQTVAVNSSHHQSADAAEMDCE